VRKLKLEELNRVSVEEYKNQEKLPVVIILDSIRSALNVGSFFRTADAFNMQEIILCGFTATPPHKEINKTAIGATESVKWYYEENITNAINKLKVENYTIIGIEQTSESIPLNTYEFNANKKYAIIFGNEVDGISEEVIPLLDASIEIPQYGTKHSLNVAVCGGIVMYAVMGRLISDNFIL
jgi:tRNA G18 (ribose-2'-O)-methylase SpoU